jgi:transcriptional regulator with XRE-family HTH domain
VGKLFFLTGGVFMFINKTDDGRNNICGKKIAVLRTGMRISQRELAERLQVCGIDIDKNAIQRIEAGKRFVTDIELKVMAKFFDLSLDALLSIEDN